MNIKLIFVLGIFCSAEISVFGYDGSSVTLLSTGRFAKQSSTGDKAGPNRAIDGNYKRIFRQESCSLTNSTDHKPTWELDMSGNTFIERINIYGSDKYIEELRGAKVVIRDAKADKKQWTKCDTLPKNLKGDEVVNLNCGMVGRYIKIKSTGTVISLCEVEVFGLRVEPVLISTQRSARSSTIGADSHLAVDGNTNQVFSRGSCMSTDLESRPWWEVDLGGRFYIDRVVLFNADTGGDQLGPLEVLVDQSDKKSQHSLWKVCGRLRRHSHNFEIVNIACNSEGRYIRVRNLERSVLTLCEVRVWGISLNRE